MNATDSVAEIDAIVAARTFHGSIARGEDDPLALVGSDRFAFGLCARLLFHQEEFAALPIAPRLPE